MRKNSLLVRLLASILALLLCGCGTTAVSPDPAPEEAAHPLPESSVPEEPVERPVTEFTIAGFDKESPGDFGYQAVLTSQEELDLTQLLDMEN